MDTIHERDGRTNTSHQAVAKTCLGIASHGKNDYSSHILKWNSFKCIFVGLTVAMSDDQQRHAKFYILNFKVTDLPTSVPDPQTEVLHAEM